MKSRLPLVAFVCFSAFLAGAPVSAQPSADAQAELALPPSAEGKAEEIADRVQAFYDKTKTFKSDFKQRYTIKVRNKVKDSSGQVIFQKPGKMSWRYTNNGNRVVSDGKTIKVYEKENNQMYEQPMGKSQYPAALAFLVGGGNLKQSFRLAQLDAKKLGFPGGYVLLGEPREPTAAYQKVLLYVDAKTYHVRRVLLIDAQGNRNRFDFDKPVVNEKVPAGEFAFQPPAGTTIVRP
jgi:outer membrane lipoprotein carrier protein